MLINAFEYRGDRTVRFHTRAKCGWFYGTSVNGDPLLQLETYASDGTTSQVMQLDRIAAGKLLAIVAKVFLDSPVDDRFCDEAVSG
ncbi:hypothetical protein [Mycobacterium paragordonae]|jgi:hypothetical protein|uniref:hypothetical protein n=1 Tax=Mycobacterium paragordonae TaxID=1389713 RepID=UPI0012E190BF|nr:hypothetical protein [Mycobacterium paragordonae]